MSKHKKHNNHRVGDELYNEQRNNMVADTLEKYIDVINQFCILEGKNKDEVKKANKKIKKAIKNLRENKPEKVYNVERFYQYLDEHDF